jgi:hypothetical protein
LGCRTFLTDNCWTISFPFASLYTPSLQTFAVSHPDASVHSCPIGRLSLGSPESQIHQTVILLSNIQMNNIGMQHPPALKTVGSSTDLHTTLGSRGRKMSTTGGNRSWSEEEVSYPTGPYNDHVLTARQENYLLQTRMQKMPYKHIAAHLKKTELACRLHYHQLSHGSHRRKRTSSCSSASSANSARHSPAQYTLNGDYDYTSSESYFSNLSPDLRFNGLQSSPGNRPQHKLLLPKPPITPDDSPKYGLRINTTPATLPSQSSVDTDRLRAIYDNHRSSFWGAIAAEYGPNVSPSQLEEIWRHQPGQHSHFMQRPPTPGESPERSLLKPSPFPAYGLTSSLPSGLDGGPTPLTAHASSAVSAPDRLPFYGHPGANAYSTTSVTNPASYAHSYSATSAGAYGATPTLGSTPDLLGRTAGGWGVSQQATGSVGGAPTAITALLTENKCPRHGNSGYCVGGNCLS